MAKTPAKRSETRTPKAEILEAQGSFTLITEPKALNAFITKACGLYHNAMDAIHVAAVSALYHAFKDGQYKPLNNLFAELKTNDKTALRNYIYRIEVACGFGEEIPRMGLHQDEYLEAHKRGKMFTYSSKEQELKLVSVDDLSDPEAKKMLKDARKFAEHLCVKHLINPMGLNEKTKEGWTRFNERNNLAEIAAFGNTEAVKAILGIKAKLQGKNTDVSSIHPKMKGLIEEYAGKAEQLGKQLSLDTEAIKSRAASARAGAEARQPSEATATQH